MSHLRVLCTWDDVGEEGDGPLHRHVVPQHEAEVRQGRHRLRRSVLQRQKQEGGRVKQSLKSAVGGELAACMS